MDLLVYLIEHARMSIYDIQISEITSQYLAYIDEMKAQDIAVAQEFMVLAAELIELKSRMLLPGSTDSDNPEEEDPRSELTRRILEYKQYKEMADFLGEQQEATWHIHTKPMEDMGKYADDPEEFLRGDLHGFAEAFKAFIVKKQRMEEMRHRYESIERQRMSVETRMGQIFSLFKKLKKKTMRFSEMLEEDKSNFNKVVTFMSLLEMLKEKKIDAEQKKRFGDIDIKLLEGSDDQ